MLLRALTNSISGPWASLDTHLEWQGLSWYPRESCSVLNRSQAPFCGHGLLDWLTVIITLCRLWFFFHFSLRLEMFSECQISLYISENFVKPLEGRLFSDGFLLRNHALMEILDWGFCQFICLLTFIFYFSCSASCIFAYCCII